MFIARSNMVSFCREMKTITTPIEIILSNAFRHFETDALVLI